jgi:FlaA1/EpsC-like NDP-sugar epimerase
MLGRKPATGVPVCVAQARGARVLVTGAGGFIGAEMVRVLAGSGAAKIVLLDICEQNLFAISSEMSARTEGRRCAAVLGSVCDGSLLDALFEEHRPEIVMHAAALKHVPLMESNPFAAVETNGLGTLRVARAAEKHGARQMVLVSTDKAVAPRSIMGAAKRMAELIMLAPAKTRRCAVRLVNVIGSPGSVGTIFAEQIAQGGPVTVTHAEARRFFLTVGEAAGLLGEAMEAEARGVLVPDGGEPLAIAELARRMIAGGGRDVPMVFTEPRAGEKLSEALISGDERREGKITRSLYGVASEPEPNLAIHFGAVESAITARDLPLLLQLVCEAVPDYRPSAQLRDAAAARPAQLACAQA